MILVRGGDITGAQELAALVTTSDGKTMVNPPWQGWPLGDDFSIHFVPNSDEHSTTLAQSTNFAIKEPTVSSATTSVSGSHTLTTSITVATYHSLYTDSYTPTITGGSPDSTQTSGGQVNSMAAKGLVLCALSVMGVILA
ncbi:hypothetical protein C8J56DRAFT_545680 [Mycena floridula]|nr:hypothetical protein C8J56DRAFT_545680 [Mycena floridula]